MPQLAASYVFNSPDPNFTRDQVQTLEELYTYGGWNEGDSRYPNESSLTKIDLGHITFVVETNKHYTYVKIDELDEENNIIGHHYGWTEFTGAGGGEVTPGPNTDPGELGIYAYFKSLVFKRGPVSPAPATPEGGDFSHPVPEGWSDGVPAATVTGEEAIWMSTRVFSSGGVADTSFTSEWTAPTLIADTEWKDFEFSELETLDAEHAEPNKQYPSDVATNGWSNTATEDTIWMAMRDVESGAYKQGSHWEIVKIKGEDGEQAFKIKILGKLTNVNDLEEVPNPQYLDAYIIGNNVYVYDGDSWENSGPFKGTFDETKDWAYLHIKYSDDGGQSFTAFGGEVPGKWVGTYCDYLIQDSNDVLDYFWKAVGGGDGFGYEYIYKLTIDDEAPAVPDDHENANGDDWQSFDFVPNNWTDDPGRIDDTWRWCWVCHRVCINGVWGEFKGAHGKTAAEGGVAALYAHYGTDAVASSASRSFMIFTWTALNSTLETPAPFVPVKPEDNVAKWNVLDNVLELNEGQSWAWSNEGQSGVWNVNPGNAQSKFLWMSTATFSEALGGEIVGHWSDPVRLTGDDGRNGTDGVDTAFGYRLCDTMEEFAALIAPTLSDPHNEDSFADSRWKDHPTGISPAHPIEAASVGTFNKETLTWTYGAPFIWARWGEDGIDGDGVEYLFFIATEEDVVKTEVNGEIQIDLENLNWLPTTEAQLSEFLGGDAEKINSFYYDHYNEWLPEGTGWTDDPSDVGPFQPYEFVSIRRFQYDEVAKEGKWGLWSEPALWAKYAKDGEAGRSVFTSMAFTRTTVNLSGTKPKGGTVEDPRPTETWSSSSDDATLIQGIVWYDTIPSDSNAPVWMTSRIFDDSLTGEGTGWKSPTKLQDTPEFQVEYTDEEEWHMTENGVSTLPSLNDYIDFVNFPYEGINEAAWRQAALEATNAHWGDIGDPDDPNSPDVIDPWWMITARRDHNGVWSKWAIHKIKGEKGEPGTSISVKGSLDSYRDLGDLNGDPAGQVDHSEVSNGDCYVINGLLWIYDGNSTKTSPYSTDYVTDPTGNGQIQGDKYAGFSCQGQFKGDPGTNSWIHVKFANKCETTGADLDALIADHVACLYNNDVYIEFTGSTHLGNVPGKYAGIAITNDVNIPPTAIEAYEWTEWRGDDLYGTEQIFILSADRPDPPTRPNSVSEADWYTFDYVPDGWSDTPLDPDPDHHCWVCTRRLSDPEDREWQTAHLYTRYATDGNDGIDGAVNEFIYHLGDRNDAPEINPAKAKQYAIEGVRPENTINDVASQEGVSSTASWWASDASRDYCPADTNSGYWTDNPQGVADEDGQRVEYYAYRTREYDDAHNKYVWSSWSPVKVWSSWGQKGHDGDGVEYIFTMTETYDTPDTPTSDNAISANEPAKNWGDYDFVPKVAIAGTDPVEYQVWTDDPQEVNSTLRYQWVSMRRSHSVDPDAASVWSEFSDVVLWNKYTEDGKDGRTEEFIYFLSKYGSNDQPIIPTIDISRAHKDGETPDKTGLSLDDWQELEDYLPALGNPTDFGYPITPAVYWNDNPYSISQEWPIEYCASRFKKDGVWSAWGAPYIWSSWGQKGHDGDGVEYIFTRTANKDVVPVLTAETGAFADNAGKHWTDDDFVPKTSIPGTNPVQYLDWTDDPQGVTKDLRVEWVSIRKTFEGEWATDTDHQKWSDPKIWKEYDDSILEEKVYHYGGKTTDPVLNQVWNYRGQKVNSLGESLQQLDGFIPSDIQSEPGTAPINPYDGEGDYDPNGWTPFKKGITADNKYEYEATRTKNPDTGVWSEFRISRYAAWGEDGDSVEFVFWMVSQEGHEWIQANKGETGIFPNSDDYEYDGLHYYNTDPEFLPYLELFGDNGVNQVRMRAQDDPSDIVTETPYVYSSKREKRHGEWQPFGPIFLYTQLLAMPEYACTLNLSEDMQGVAVSDEGTCFKTIGRRVGFSNEELNLRYGPSALIVGQVKVAPITRRYVNGVLTTTVGNAIEVWNGSQGQVANTINISTYDTDNNPISNTININVSKSEEFYFCWFSWSSSTNIVFGKKPDGSPDDLGFVIYAYGGVAENSTEKYGTATFTIHPIEGNEFYEIDPGIGCDIFKKLKATPFTKSSLDFWLEKKIQTENSYTYAYCNEEEWNASYQEGHDNVWVRYRGDESETWYTARAAIPSDTHRLVVDTDDYRYSVVPGIFNDDGTPYLKFNMVLFDNNGPDNSIRNFFPDLMDGITIQIWVGDVLHDEEFIPVVYDGKKGNRGDYYKEETAYYLSQSDQAPSAPATNVTLVTPSGTDSNDADKWLNTHVSPTATYRYLYAAKRLNRYYGDTDEELGEIADTIAEAGTWDTPFLFASRSVGIQGDEGRGISRRTEYYKWTSTESAPSKTPLTDWTEGSVPTAGNNDKFLWNFEVITYTKAPLTEETAVELVGSISEDGRSITGLTEYYLWSGSNSGITINGNTWYEADELPNPTGNQIYLWNYEEVSYDKEPLLVQTDPVVIAVNGKSISSVTEYYMWTATEGEKPSNSSTTGWTANTIPASSTVTNAKYLWNFESVSYNYGAETKTPVSLLTTLVEDGRGISGVDEYYIWWNSGTTAPAKTESSWYQSNNPNSPTETNKYLWNYEVIHFDDGSADLETDPVLLSQNGTDGAVGRGINSIQEYYLWTASSTLTTGSTNAYQAHTATISNPNSPAEGTYGWDTNNNSKWYTSPTYITEAQIASKGYKYLWNFEILSYTSGTSTTRTSPAIIGTIGEDGRGISGVAEYYLWSENSSDVSDGGQSGTGWVTAANLTPPTGNEKYLWNYEVVTYTSGTPSYSISTPIIISTKGDKGDDGKYSQFVYFRSRLELGSSYTIQENGTDSGNYGFYDGTNTTWTTNADGEALPVFKYTRSSNTFVVSSIQANTSTSTSTYNPFRVSSTSISTVTDDPQGVNDTWRYEYESMGVFDPSTNIWKFSKPALHNYKATNGTNGDPGTREFCMYRAGARSSNYSLSTNPTNVKALNQIGWVIDYNSVTTSDSNPVIWAISTGIPLNEADPDLSDTTNRTWSDPRVVFEKGEKGASIAGPAVRGPVRWEDAVSGREWLSGKGESGFTDSDKWIDIVTRTTNTGGQEVTNYYICIKAHTHTGSTSDVYVPGRNNSEYWDNADAQYKFVATEVLLANSAKINVLSNNALLLMDNQDEVVGGARGGDSADDVIFWAGTEESNMTALESAIPSAPFRVTFDGSLTSTKGTIGGWAIGPDSLSASYTMSSTNYDGLDAGPKVSLSTNYTYQSNKPTYYTDNVYLYGRGLRGSENYYTAGTSVNVDSDFELNPGGLDFSSSGTWPVGSASRTASLGSGYLKLSSDAQMAMPFVELTLNETDLSVVASLYSDRLYIIRDDQNNVSNDGSLTVGLDEISLTKGSGGVIFNVNASTGNMTVSGDIKTTNGNLISGSYASALSFGVIPFKIAIMIDDSDRSTLFTTSSGNWYFNGTDTGISATTYPNLYYNNTGGYYVSGSSGSIYTGVVPKTVTKRGDTIYIEI